MRQGTASGTQSMLHSAPAGASDGRDRVAGHPMDVIRALRAARFGPFEVDVRSGELVKHGRRIRLQNQPLHVLVMLLEHAGEVVTRHELRERLWTDSFVDFEHGLNSAINRLREALGDSAEHPRYIETIPRRGYRFVTMVDSTIPASDATRASSPPIRSVAILPFETLTGDAEYFIDAVTDALTTELAQAGALHVISRASAMRYKTDRKSIPEIARELKVDAVVVGTVRRTGDQVRITAELIEAV